MAAVVTIRCTRNLLRRLRAEPPQSSTPPATSLGDWHAMSSVVLAPTNNRRILGCMRDAETALEYAIHSGRYASLEDLQWYLTDRDRL